MRAQVWVGLLTITVAAPFAAHAENQATSVSDLWDSGRVQALPYLRQPAATEAREPTSLRAIDTAAREPISLPAINAAARESTSVRAINTYQSRSFHTAPATSLVAAPTKAAPTSTTPQVAAAPEMSVGLAATGLTLLFGGIAILRTRRTRSTYR